jgi:hypothetical protein
MDRSPGNLCQARSSRPTHSSARARLGPVRPGPARAHREPSRPGRRYTAYDWLCVCVGGGRWVGRGVWGGRARFLSHPFPRVCPASSCPARCLAPAGQPGGRPPTIATATYHNAHAPRRPSARPPPTHTHTRFPTRARARVSVSRGVGRGRKGCWRGLKGRAGAGQEGTSRGVWGGSEQLFARPSDRQPSARPPDMHVPRTGRCAHAPRTGSGAHAPFGRAAARTSP